MTLTGPINGIAVLLAIVALIVGVLMMLSVLQPSGLIDGLGLVLLSVAVLLGAFWTRTPA